MTTICSIRGVCGADLNNTRCVLTALGDPRVLRPPERGEPVRKRSWRRACVRACANMCGGNGSVAVVLIACWAPSRARLEWDSPTVLHAPSTANLHKRIESHANRSSPWARVQFAYVRVWCSAVCVSLCVCVCKCVSCSCLVAVRATTRFLCVTAAWLISILRLPFRPLTRTPARFTS